MHGVIIGAYTFIESNGMPEKNQLEYFNPAAGGRSWSIPLWLRHAIATVGCLLAIVFFLILEDLIRSPYRPPFDMTPFLSDSERTFARMLQAICAAVALGAIGYVGMTWRRKPRT